MKIRSKLNITKLALVGLALALAGVLVHLSTELERSFDRDYRETRAVVLALTELRFAGQRILSSTNEIILNAALGRGAGRTTGSADTAAPGRESAELQHGIARYRTALETLTALPPAHDGDRIATENRIPATAEGLVATILRIAGAVRTGTSDREIRDARGRLERLESAFLGAIDHGLTAARDHSAEHDATVASAIVMGRTALLTCVAIVLIVLFVAFRLISNSISQPVDKLIAAARRIGRGDFDSPIDVGPGDEFGDLAAAIRGMSRDLRRKTAELESEVAERKRAELAQERAKEEAEFANRAKSKFLALMSHELRTPLNAIIGFSEIINGETFGPVGSTKYRSYAKDINDAGQHLLELINDILDLAKVESGMDGLRESDVDIAVIVHSVIAMVRDRAEKAQITLVSDIDETLPALRADARKLKQILANLLSNAVKFTNSGGRVSVSVGRAAGGDILFRVEDTGIGIAESDIETAMTAFGQIDTELNRKYEGTGLGLPLSKALTELHGGSLAIRSEPGVGTSAVVSLPPHLALPAVPEIAAAPSLGGEAHG